MRRLLTALALASLAACSTPRPSSAVRTFPTAEHFAAVPIDSVHVFSIVDSADLAAAPGTTFVPVAEATQPIANAMPADEQALVEALRMRSAPLGANAIVRLHRYDARRYLAVRLARTGLSLVEMLARSRFAQAQREAAALAGSAARSPAATSAGGEVQVKGYTKKDGTYVRPHTRSAPRRP